MTIRDLAYQPHTATHSELLSAMDSNCTHRVLIHTIDRLTGQPTDMWVPCGCCEACIGAKQESWVTRMTLHTLNYKHVYYLTLTYAPIYNEEHPLCKFVMEQTSDLFWHKDDYNYKHRLCTSPCLTSRSAMPLFFKRLRARIDSPLTYVYCTENGGDFGRPHYHAIIYTDAALTKQDFMACWQIPYIVKDGVYLPSRGKNCLHYPLGNVECEDVKHEAFCKMPQDPTGAHRSGACFKYVAKYVGKKSYDFDTTRIRWAYDDYQKTIQRTYVPVLISKLNARIINNSLQTMEGSEQVFDEDGLYTNYLDFLRDNLPRVRFSLRTPIGSLYLQEHFDEVRAASKNGLRVSGVSFFFPPYFRRKLEERDFPFKMECEDHFGRRSSSYGSLPYWHRLADCLNEISHNLHMLPNSMQYDEEYAKFHIQDDPLMDGFTTDLYHMQDTARIHLYIDEQVFGFRKHLRSLYNPVEGTRYVFTPDGVSVLQYDRASRSYQEVASMEYDDFLCWLDGLFVGLDSLVLDKHGANIVSRMTYNDFLLRMKMDKIDLPSAYEDYQKVKQMDYEKHHPKGGTSL